MANNRIPPHDLEAEQAVIASAIYDNDSLAQSTDDLSPADFYSMQHQIIFGAMVELFNSNMPVDMLTVCDKLTATGKLESAGGPGAISGLAGRISTTANINHWIGIVRSKAMLRRFIDTARELAMAAYAEPENAAEFLDEATASIEKINQRVIKSVCEPVYESFRKEYNYIYEHKGQVGFRGLKTGYFNLDSTLQGIDPGDLILLAGRPSMGKTALALNICHNLTFKDKKTVLFFSIEMATRQLTQRLIGIDTGISLKSMNICDLIGDEWVNLLDAQEFFKASKLFIDGSSSITVAQMRARAKKLKIENKSLDMIVVDHIGFIKKNPKLSTNDALGEISRGLKAIAKELDCPLIALSQLNRGVEQREDKRPMLSDLRDSGNLEQDADVVILLYREGYYNYTADQKKVEANVAKARNRGIGMALLEFDREKGRFNNWEK
jgi:replicative DNA helicase